jgi:hypothetical protein
MNDETIRLILDLANSSKDVGALVDKLKELKKSADDVGDTYEVLGKDLNRYSAELGTVDHAMDELVRDAYEQTQAQRAIRQALEETEDAATKARGDKRADGRGILAGSYALQDFIAVMSNGGDPVKNFGRAIGAMSNNMDQIARSMGMGVGMAGGIMVVTQLTAALIPLIHEWYTGISGEDHEKAMKALEDIHKEVDKTHDAYLKMLVKPTNPQEESAALFKEYLQGPQMAQVRSGISQQITPAEAAAVMFPEETEIATRAGKGDGKTDAQLEAEAHQIVRGSKGNISIEQARESTGLTARRQLRHKMVEIRRRAAEKMIQQAGTSTPEGRTAAERIIGMAGEQPGTFPQAFGSEMSDLTTEGMEAWERGEDKRQAGLAARTAAAKAQHGAEQKGIKDQKKIDALNLQGQENQRIGNAAQEKERQAERKQDAKFQEAVDRFEDRMADRLPKMKAAQQKAEALDYIQQQTGVDRGTARAAYQDFLREQKQLQQVQGETMGMMLGITSSTKEQLQMWMQFKAQASQQMNRSAASNNGSF